jgi:hypothetical protein
MQHQLAGMPWEPIEVPVKLRLKFLRDFVFFFFFFFFNRYRAQQTGARESSRQGETPPRKQWKGRIKTLQKEVGENRARKLPRITIAPSMAMQRELRAERVSPAWVITLRVRTRRVNY